MCPLQLDSLSDLKLYVETYSGIPIFYQIQEVWDKKYERATLNSIIYTVMAGKAFWQGEADSDLEDWLKTKGAIKVKRYVDLETLFR